MNREFLKEAIANAKDVKETAIANAKATLEESFAPTIRSMIASKINEMEENEDSIESDFNDIDMEDFNDIAESQEEMGLDEILNELEEELSESTPDLTTEVKEESTDEDDIDITDDDIDEDEKEEDEEIDLDEMTTEDLKIFVEKVIADMVESGELESGEQTPGEELETANDEIEIPTMEVNENKDNKVKKLTNELKTKTQELKEAYSVIGKIKTDMSDVNLLNAKLLYTNKIFRSKNLTEAQKIKVLGSFDKTSSVKEVKLVFETILEGLKTPTKSINENLIGSASKQIGVTASIKKPIVETNEMVSRFKKLAGII